MIRQFVFIFFIIGSSLIFQKSYVPVDQGSKVHFVIRNFGINTGGDFTGLKGSINFDPKALSSSKLDVSIAATTVDTDNSSRDKSLRSDEYFDVKKYPEINLASTKISLANNSEGAYIFTGNITIHGVKRGITFPFNAELVNGDYVFTGNFDLNRLDFGVGEKSAVLSNKVSISLKVIAKQK
ncbi:MAG: YceI family protein [Ginsengibacter sp.]